MRVYTSRIERTCECRKLQVESMFRVELFCDECKSWTLKRGRRMNPLFFSALN